jgi:tetratricopeptide (TPR) repeat protein
MSVLALTVTAAVLACCGTLQGQSTPEASWRREIIETSSLRHAGDYAAAETRLSSLVVEIEKVQRDTHVLAAALNGLGLVHADRGNLAAAEQALLRAQRIWENAGSRYRDHLIQCISSRVSVYLDGGDTESAERLLRSRLPAPGATPEPAAAGLLYHLGVLEFSQGRYEEAMRTAEQAAELWRPVVGPHDPALASMYNMMGMACFRSGRPEAALGHFEHSLQILDGASEPILLSKVLVNLGNAFAELRRYAEADRALARSRAIVERTLGPQDPALAVALQNHAPVLRKLGRKAEAKQADRIAKAILQARPPQAMRAHTVDVTELAKSASLAR